MPKGVRRGPVCQEINPVCVDEETMCLAASPQPNSLGQNGVEDYLLKMALTALEAKALNFGRAFINDASVRENYVRKIRQMSEEILADVRAGRASAEAGAELARDLRNHIMEQVRAQSSFIGRAAAERLKASGKTIEQLIEETSKKLFPGSNFSDLTRPQRRKVFEAIIESSGRSRPTVTVKIARWRFMGRACLIFTIAVSTYNIWTAKNRVHAGLREGLVLGGGAAGGALAGAATGLVCGPGAPVCSSVLFVVGGIMGALAGTATADYLDSELRELADWLGEPFRLPIGTSI